MDPKIKLSWEEFLNPEVTRPRIIAASIYIAGFELLKDSIVDRIRSFFWAGFDRETGEKIDPEYKSDVLTRNGSPIYASLDWLKEQGAIDDADLATYERVKRCRNTLAHELLSVLSSSGLPADYTQCFADMVALLRKIEIWWIVNVEIPTNPDFDGSEEIDEDGILPGPIMGMRLLMDIALGDEKESRFYYDEFRKRAGGGEASASAAGG
jgi:hypothetical protein